MGQAKTWKCDVCGYVHSGDNPPDTCPLCGSTSLRDDEKKLARKKGAGRPESAQAEHDTALVLGKDADRVEDDEQQDRCGQSESDQCGGYHASAPVVRANLGRLDG